MKKHIRLYLFAAIYFLMFPGPGLMLVMGIQPDETIQKVENPVFVFNNAFNTRGTPYSEIADLLNELGYDGIEHREVKGLFDLKKELDHKGLKIFADYVEVDIDNEPHYIKEWKEAIPKMAGTGLILWVHVHSEKYKPSDPAADEIIVPILQEMADFARPYGIRIAIYPHRNFLVETAEHSFRLAEKADRENIGAVFNLVHFLWEDQESNLEELIEMVTARLFAVSISGADQGGYPGMSANQLIQPLGEGSYDVYKVVELLLNHGYQGPIGFQCYKIQGEPTDFLRKSMDTWNSFKELYESGTNRLSEEEISDGWELLFDGYSPAGWRGITKETFPLKGWDIRSGELRSNATDRSESANGGDVITEKEYGPDFELAWDWKMLTKGGNSGIKYFVEEELTTNGNYGYGLEYQILDDMNHSWMLEGKMQPNDYHTMGSLYEFFPASETKKVKPLGEWNSSRIISRDNQVEHWLNGQKILEYERGGKDFVQMLKNSKFKEIENFGQQKQGNILLQDHGSQVSFRNIKIKEL